MYANLRSHAPQFFRYLLSGGTAAALEIGTYKVMLIFNLWYVAAAFLSGFVGLFTAFVLHKYFVFRKREQTGQHVIRYMILQLFNLCAQAGIVYLLVDVGGANKILAKVVGIGCTVSWNFFLYKLFVYV